MRCRSCFEPLKVFATSDNHAPSSLLEEIANLFADSPSPKAILEFRESQTLIDGANELLEFSRTNQLDEFSAYADQRDVLDSVTSHFAQLNSHFTE